MDDYRMHWYHWLFWPSVWLLATAIDRWFPMIVRPDGKEREPA